MKLMFAINAGTPYKKMFSEHGWDVSGDFSDLQDGNIDLLVFTGGTDVNPHLYGETHHWFTQSSDTRRDEYEQTLFQKALEREIPMVGICRGAQFLCVMNGGKLYQHVSGHTGPHKMVTSDGREFGVTSTHHQMMKPSKNGELIGWAEGLSAIYETALGSSRPPENYNEPEVVKWKDTKSIGFQYHPEYFNDYNAEAVKFFFEKLMETINGD